MKKLLMGLMLFSMYAYSQESQGVQCVEKAVEMARVLRGDLGAAPLASSRIETRYSESELRQIKIEVFIFDRGESGLVIEIIQPQDAYGQCRFSKASAWHD